MRVSVCVCTHVGMFSVTLYEVDLGQKHNKIKKSLSGRAQSLLKSRIPYVILVPTHSHPTGGWGHPTHHHRGEGGALLVGGGPCRT